MTWDHVWLGIGLLGQALFSARFLVQWIASERQKESVVPTYFWYFSIGGGVTLLAYAIYRTDPVFIIGQASGLFIYARNLWFIHRKPAAVHPSAAPGLTERPSAVHGATRRSP